MIKILHLSDIHLGSGFSHGRINPETGLNTRLEDFVATLGRCIDRAIAEPVDLVLFGGDAFPDATPLPIVQEAFAAQFRPPHQRQNKPSWQRAEHRFHFSFTFARSVVQ
ncbi:exonuclease subunit SbcD [Leptolyngbya sp. 7M]|uniref:exonuclease subunit SbcD n=1 Tax=Leptolyngbya sp. 7M TaxID=2812896 RepID=UPI0021F11635|nr:exonuclease subunit SbcD [Leptolyngbya sp. 7M]